MTDVSAEAEKLMEAAAAYLDLPIEDAYRAGIKMHLVAARGIAEHVLAFELEDDAEPAPVYAP
ncbi:hypothetical protein D3C87_1777290 [compost metagenome]